METFSALLPFCAGNSGLTGEFSTHASDTELWCFLWFVPEPTLEQTKKTPVISDAIVLIVTSLYWYQLVKTRIADNMASSEARSSAGMY